MAGKPHQPICDLVIARGGESGIVVGDRPDTDGLLAKSLNWKFALVLSGVTSESDLPIDPVPDSVHCDLPALVEEYLG